MNRTTLVSETNLQKPILGLRDRTIAICLILLSFAFCIGEIISGTQFAFASTSTSTQDPPAQQTPPTAAPQTPTEDQQQALIASLKTLSETAQSATEFNRLIDQCRAASQQSLTPARAQYVRQLLGWALCRRGERRLDLAAEFASVGNQTQSAEILRQAQADFSETLETQPGSWRAWRGQGIAQVQSRQFAEAETCFSRVIELQPNELTGWFNRAEVRYQLRNFAEALADYQKVLDQQPNDSQALAGRGLCRAAQGDWQAALADHEVICQQYPDNSAALINRGDAHLGLGNWLAALSDFQTAAEKHSLTMGWQRQAWLLAACPDDSIRNADRALELIEKVFGADGKTGLDSNAQALAWETKACALAAKGNFAEAQALQRQAIERYQPADPAAAERLELYLAEKPFVISKD